MPSERHDATTCAIGNDIFVFGGDDDDDNFQNSVCKYDTETDEWSTLAPMPHACRGHSTSVLGGLVYIVGAR
jgi:N-acetylneuraminic acid mutarotase